MYLQLCPNNEVRVTLSKTIKTHRASDRQGAGRELVSVDATLYRARVAANPFRPLDIPKLLSGQRLKPRKRTIGLTENARKQILRLGACFCPASEERTNFVTGTLPGSTHEAMQSFAEMSGEVVRRVQNAVRDWCIVRNEPIPPYLWVWELQKRGAPHLHAVFEFSTPAIASEFRLYWGQLWGTVLRGVQGLLHNDLFARLRGGTHKDSPEVWQTDAQLVEKDAARYLSSYMKKGAVPRRLRCYWPRGRAWGKSRELDIRLERFMGENSIHLPIELPPDAPLDVVEQIIKQCIEAHSDGYATVVSPWFQDHTATVFGFLRDGAMAMKSLVESIIRALRVVAIPARMSGGYSWGYRSEIESATGLSIVKTDRRESVASLDGQGAVSLSSHPPRDSRGGLPCGEQSSIPGSLKCPMVTIDKTLWFTYPMPGGGTCTMPVPMAGHGLGDVGGRSWALDCAYSPPMTLGMHKLREQIRAKQATPWEFAPSSPLWVSGGAAKRSNLDLIQVPP